MSDHQGDIRCLAGRGQPHCALKRGISKRRWLEGRGTAAAVGHGETARSGPALLQEVTLPGGKLSARMSDNSSVN